MYTFSDEKRKPSMREMNVVHICCWNNGQNFPLDLTYIHMYANVNIYIGYFVYMHHACQVAISVYKQMPHNSVHLYYFITYLSIGVKGN